MTEISDMVELLRSIDRRLQRLEFAAEHLREIVDRLEIIQTAVTSVEERVKYRPSEPSLTVDWRTPPHT